MSKKAVFMVFIALAAVTIHGNTSGVQIKSKGSNVIKFTGTIIDNKSLKEHSDSLASFMRTLSKETVYGNVKAGYSLYMTDGKIYKLAFPTVEAIWNDIRSPRGDCTLHSLKISGNARKMGGDTLKIIDFVEVKQ